MLFVDCKWELDNIGKRTCEISYEEHDVFHKAELKEKIQDYEYIVVKVPVSHSSINFGLSQMGFTMIETQLNISKKFKDFPFDDRLIKVLYPHVQEIPITTEDDFQNLLSRISIDMFSTDRIYLDPQFTHELSRRRYTNWMRTEFDRKTSGFKKIIYKGEEVGFGMYRSSDGVVHGLLGGVFETKQTEGIGFLTACSGFLTAHRSDTQFKKVMTSISSNNTPMVQIYNYLQFRIDKMTYVFVKHN